MIRAREISVIALRREIVLLYWIGITYGCKPDSWKSFKAEMQRLNKISKNERNTEWMLLTSVRVELWLTERKQ